MCSREPGQLKTGTQKYVEDGLGAAYRSIYTKATTGSPVTVISCFVQLIRLISRGMDELGW